MSICPLTGCCFPYLSCVPDDQIRVSNLIILFPSPGIHNGLFIASAPVCTCPVQLSFLLLRLHASLSCLNNRLPHSLPLKNTHPEHFSSAPHLYLLSSSHTRQKHLHRALSTSTSPLVLKLSPKSACHALSESQESDNVYWQCHSLPCGLRARCHWGNLIHQTGIL